VNKRKVGIDKIWNRKYSSNISSECPDMTIEGSEKGVKEVAILPAPLTLCQLDNIIGNFH
jgi:hypothetical protein